MSAEPTQGEMSDALTEEIWGYGHEIDTVDLLNSLAAAGLRLELDPEATIWDDVGGADEHDAMISAEFAQKLDAISEFHEMIHQAADDPEDTIFVALTEKEFFMTALGQVHNGIQHCCMEERADIFSQKLFELYDAQRASAE